MNIQDQIKEYIATQPEPKRIDMQDLHRIIMEVMPKCKLWFLDGKDDKDKTVSNPINICAEKPAHLKSAKRYMPF